jgi:uncharacterized protein YajQ (UPF0234 family)
LPTAGSFIFLAGVIYICRTPNLTTMPSFDIVSKVEAQALDNAVNVTSKEITNRFDFKGSHVLIDWTKKSL